MARVSQCRESGSADLEIFAHLAFGNATDAITFVQSHLLGATGRFAGAAMRFDRG